jgi:hypothetical protein
MVSQYGRALNYLHCKIAAVVNTGVAQCDCEKQLKDAPGNSQPIPLQKAMAREKSMDDVFVNIAQVKWVSSHSISALPASSNNDPLIPIGFNKTIFQPPKA